MKPRSVGCVKHWATEVRLSEYPRAWIVLFAFLVAGMVLAFLPYFLSEPVDPTLGPLGKSLQAELQFAFRAAGATTNQVSCYGSKGARIISCGGAVAQPDVITSELTARGWMRIAGSAPKAGVLQRDDLTLSLIVERGIANISVFEKGVSK